mmetsp:Transcript_17325/g.34939  ORF Transcript_17325/g.34939 Transcript_17325/m.34939 type:complete len:208 (+) Transcript_17325:987-1610(+)
MAQHQSHHHLFERTREKLVMFWFPEFPLESILESSNELSPVPPGVTPCTILTKRAVANMSKTRQHLEVTILHSHRSKLVVVYNRLIAWSKGVDVQANSLSRFYLDNRIQFHLFKIFCAWFMSCCMHPCPLVTACVLSVVATHFVYRTHTSKNLYRSKPPPNPDVCKLQVVDRKVILANHIEHYSAESVVFEVPCVCCISTLDDIIRL